jgi:carbonic anhydrase/acetyltransferase-like protein (isoleucine patch superfamily)
MSAPLTVTLAGRTPAVDPSAWIAPGAVLAGAVTLAAETSVWYGTVVRADTETITVGARTNLQDGVVVHADPGFPVTVGRGVSVGHRAVLHGCTIGDDVLVGMGAVVLNGARVGSRTLIAAGAVVLEGADIPPGSLVAGLPAKVRRPLTDDELGAVRRNAASYCALVRVHAEAVRAP